MDLQKVFNVLLLAIFITLEMSMGIFIFVISAEEGKDNLIMALFGVLMTCIAYGIYKLLPFVRV